jgi:DNA-binding NarL/FixJ family response regulator
MSPTDTRPTLVLADDHCGLLDHVAKLLTPGYNILAAVSNGLMAVDAVRRFNPDVTILDIAMPELDGFAAAREMKQYACSTRIVFLTLYDDDDYISAAVESGALGYVLKCFVHSDLIPAIESALAGHYFVSAHSSSAGRLAFSRHYQSDPVPLPK